MRVVFFGTPQFAQTILAYLIDKNVEIAAVVTRPDQAVGRSKALVPPPVKELALAKSLPVYQPTKASDPEFASFLNTLDADFFIVSAYAEILKQNILDIPRLGCINVHASILPKYRGAAPIQRSIMAGETETGVTIMKMALKMDAGDILAIRKTDITPEMTAGELMQKLADLGKEALLEVIQKMMNGEEIGEKQDSSEATFAKKLHLEDGEIDWFQPCETVHNQIRGVTPKPGAWCWVELKGVKRRLLIKKSSLQPQTEGEAAEIDRKESSKLIVGCGKGSVRLLNVQLEGKKMMTDEEFLRGIHLEKLSIMPRQRQ